MRGKEHLEELRPAESDMEALPLRTRLHNLFRKIAMVDPTEEEWKRMRVRYLEANTVWVEGTDIGFAIESLDMNYRVEPDDPTLSAAIKANIAEEAANNELREMRKAKIRQKVYGSSDIDTEARSPNDDAGIDEAEDAQEDREAHIMQIPNKNAVTADGLVRFGTYVDSADFPQSHQHETTSSDKVDANAK